MGLFDNLPQQHAQRASPPAQLAAVRTDLHPYAAKAIAAELGRLDALPRPWQPGASYWDTTTFEVACNLVELANSPWAGYSLTDAEHDLRAHAPADQAWGDRAHTKCWESARERVGSHSRPEPGPLEEVTVVELDTFRHEEPTDLAPSAEEEFWSARPVLTHLHDFARARMVAPWAVLGVTLARALALTPWTVHLPSIVGSRASLNFAIALVAASGGGKGGAEGVAHDAITMPHLPEHRIGSGEAIAHCLKHRLPARAGGGTDWNSEDHNALINLPEVDKLTAQAQRQGATIMPELRAAWSGESLGHVTADASRRIPVEKHEYRLALILGVQPGRAGGLLDDADGGFPQRLLWLPAYDRQAPDMDHLPPCPPPMEWKPPRPGVYGYGGQAVDVCQQAVREVREARWRANRGEGDPLDGHLLLARLKVATGLGVLDGRYSITDEDWQLAGTIIAKSSGVRAGLVAELERRKQATNAAAGEAQAARQILVEERTTEAAVKRVCRVVGRKLRGEGDWTSRTVLRRAVASRDRGVFEQALEQLVEAGQIELDDMATGHGNGTGKYRWIEH